MKGIWHPDDHWRDYIERNVVIAAPGDNQGKPLRIADVPWFEKPLEKFFDYSVRQIDIIKAVGAGGTGIGECMVTGNTGRRGTALLFSTKIDDSKMQEMAGRLFVNQMDQLPAITSRYRTDATSKSREYVRSFRYPAGTEVKLQLAKESNFNMSRAEVVINDEVWKFDNALLEMAISRSEGDFSYGKLVNISSAPESEDHSANTYFLRGAQDHYHFCCPKCHNHFEPLIGHESEARYNQHRVIQWDKEGSVDHRASTVRFHCPGCSKEYTDTIRNRRALLEGADYISQRKPDDPAPPDHYSCTISGWIAWWNRWGQMLRSYLRAKEAQRSGDHEPIKMWYIQNAAQTWRGQATTDNAKLHISKDYKLEPHDAITGQPVPLSQARSRENVIWHAPRDWEYETDRYCLVDYQRAGHFWVKVIQATRGVDRDGIPMPKYPLSGGSRLMYVTKVESYEAIHELAEFFEVDPGRVFIDAGTDTKKGDIYENIVKYGWRGLAAAAQRNADKGYRHTAEYTDPETLKEVKETFQAPYSIPQFKGDRYIDPQTGDYRRAELIHWDKNWVTNRFNEIRQGNTECYFGLPSNLHELDRDWPDNEKIIRQLDSMHYVDGLWETKSSKRPEHLWDLWSMALVGMWMEQYFDVHLIADQTDLEPV
jgi:predicted RNA-binding Zn-ribbon protein involved in translation (DUF1610 family)